MDSEQLLSLLERMKDAIPQFAQAKANRVYIEQFRKSLKAELMQQSDGKTIADRENYAYAHPRMLELVQGLRDAVEIEEKHKWALERIKMDVEVWRTLNANEWQMKGNV